LNFLILFTPLPIVKENEGILHGIDFSLDLMENKKTKNIHFE